MLRTVLAAFLLLGASCAELQYDIVIRGGRVMDPESGLDGVRHIAIQGSQIVAVTEERIDAPVVIDAEGYVVAPGFIDLHQHGQSPENYKAQIHDGITSALELEIGVEDVAAWYAEREGNALVNHGASISHPYSRQIVMTGSNPGLEGPALTEAMTPAQIEELRARVQKGLEQGAVAVGFGIAYTPGATQEELNAIFAIAADFGAACHVHMRTNHEDLSNLEEVLLAAEVGHASLHIVHINSSGRERALEYLRKIREVQQTGLDVTTECYPYNRGSTLIESHLFDDWKSYTDEEIAQHIWVETGETLTRETFGPYRERGGTLITPPSYSETTVRALVAHPLTMIASDGMWIDNGRSHPRTFGTFARVLGRYVRDQGALTLMEALAKMSLWPAQRLEKRAPMMRNKGRVKVGADADLVVFDPAAVIDRATYSDPAQYSAGIHHVLVNGVVTLRDGELVAGAAAGRAIRAERPQP